MNPTELLIFRTCLALSLFTFPLLIWALFGDRARGRPRCPSCWYQMTGVPTRTCPECGRTAKHDRDLQRTRRRWFVAMPTALPPLIAYALFTNHLPMDNWRTLIPNSALIAWLEVRSSESAWYELRDRISISQYWGFMQFDDIDYSPHVFQSDGTTLFDWQWRWLHRVTIHRLNAAQTTDDILRWGFAANGLPMAHRSEAQAERYRQALVRFRDHPEPLLRWIFAFRSLEPENDADRFELIDSFIDDAHPYLRRWGAHQLTFTYLNPRSDRFIQARFEGVLTRLTHGVHHDDPDVRHIMANSFHSWSTYGNLPELTAEHIRRIRVTLEPLESDSDALVRGGWLRSSAAMISDDDEAADFLLRKLAEIRGAPNDVDFQTMVSILETATSRSINRTEFIDAAVHTLRDLTDQAAPSDDLALGYAAAAYLVQQNETSLRPYAHELPEIVEQLPADLRFFAEQLRTIAGP